MGKLGMPKETTKFSVATLLATLLFSVGIFDFSTENVFHDVHKEITELKEMFDGFEDFLSGTYCHESHKDNKRLQRLYEARRNFKTETYCDDTLGCFPTDGVFTERIINFRPNPREIINTKFKLFTRDNRKIGQFIRADNSSVLFTSNFDASKKTIIVIHGFRDDTRSKWFTDTNTELLKNGDFNVINVDWGDKGASKTLYTQATANTRVVAAEIVHLLQTLRNHRLALGNVHLIGHSLGAHIAGYVGAELRGIGRITGLDPADPYFQGCDIAIRLDPSDADFVDVIHSDADAITGILKAEGGFGTRDLSGHADFFPNGGEDQPTCNQAAKGVSIKRDGILRYLRSYLEQAISCDHSSAVQYFIKSINSCPFTATKCDDYSDFEEGRCSLNCQGDNCNYMGFRAYKPTTTGFNKYYLHTTGQGNFCTTDYNVRVTIADHSDVGHGILDLTFHGTHLEKATISLSEESKILTPGNIHLYEVAVPTNLGTIVKLEATYNHEESWWQSIRKVFHGTTTDINSLKIHQIHLQDSRGKSLHFCGSGREFPSERSVHLPYSLTSC